MSDAAKKLKLEIIKSQALSPEKRAGLIALCNRAYGEDVEPLFRAYTGATHLLAYLDGRLVSHAGWVTRWLSCNGGPLMRAAFVELVATEPDLQGQGLATAVMQQVAGEITDFELGALWPNYPDWYGRLGWQWWRGPLFIRGPHGLIQTPDDQIMVRLLPKTPPLDLDKPLSAEWREGELW